MTLTIQGLRTWKNEEDLDYAITYGIEPLIELSELIEYNTLEEGGIDQVLRFNNLMTLGLYELKAALKRLEDSHRKQARQKESAPQDAAAS